MATEVILQTDHVPFQVSNTPAQDTGSTKHSMAGGVCPLSFSSPWRLLRASGGSFSLNLSVVICMRNAPWTLVSRHLVPAGKVVQPWLRKHIPRGWISAHTLDLVFVIEDVTSQHHDPASLLSCLSHDDRLSFWK